MKTQLLEDIGENATLPPTPPRHAGHSITDQAALPVPPAQAATAPDLDSVFEEIAALEAQYQPPAQQQQQPAIEPTMPLDQPVPAPAEPSLAPDPAQDDFAATTATLRQDPLFDFTLPLPEQAASDPFTPPPSMRARPKRRYLLWAACALTGALLVQGGWWLYKERKDEGSLAFIATQAKETPRAAPEPVPADAAATPAAPAPPPLVMLEPDPPAAAAQQAQAAPRETPEPASLAQQETPVPPPEPAAPPTPRVKHEPARQVARTPIVQAETSPSGEGAMTALLRACREHGYHATQCIKQGCSVTRYGFACRGR